MSILLYRTLGYACTSPPQAQSALAWGDGDADGDGVESDSDDGGGAAGGGAAVSQERKDVEAAKEAAEAAAKETAEEKRLRLARDVLMKLDAEQRENVRAFACSSAHSNVYICTSTSSTMIISATVERGRCVS